MANTTIYIATHKEFSTPHNSFYKPIMAGASTYSELSYLKDNTGIDEISNKNAFYSELTALYWIWKNDTSKNVGLVHYHRYFNSQVLKSEKDMESILSQFDIILPTKFELLETVQSQYKKCHYLIDLQLACQKMMQQNSNFEPVIHDFLNQNKLYICNMFIMPKDILNNYLSFLFPILFSLESEIPFLTYSIYNQRVFGFLAERIFNIYIKQQKLKIFEVPIYDTHSRITRFRDRLNIYRLKQMDNKNPRKKMYLKDIE